MLFQIPIFSYLILCPLFLVIFAAFRAISSPLRGVPGPLLARFSRMWYVWQINLGKFHLKNIELHRQKGEKALRWSCLRVELRIAGPVVQLGPYLYSISDEEALKTIYSHQSNFEKSSWYDAWNLTADRDKPNLFSDRNAKRHGATRRKVSGMYSTTGLVTYEGFVDDCIVLFTMKLDQFAASKSEISLADWLQYYAFDVIGKITVSSNSRSHVSSSHLSSLARGSASSIKVLMLEALSTPLTKPSCFRQILGCSRNSLHQSPNSVTSLEYQPTTKLFSSGGKISRKNGKRWTT